MDLESIANDLATAHRVGHDDDVVAIFWLPDPDARELRLLEVMRSVATTNDIMPFRFAPTDDVPVPSVMILVSEAEFAALQDGALRLPDSWGPEAMKRLQRLA
jgi:hypothetical protein